MLGHRLAGDLADDFLVTRTVRDAAAGAAALPGRSDSQSIRRFRAEEADALDCLLDETGPDVVVNCIGIVKQIAASADACRSIAINALFPHQAAEACWRRGIRFIHFGTDCVFSGRRGPYSEDDLPDPVDLYGRSKLLGDVTGPGCLTLRTSMIGHELRGQHGLLEWFLSQRGGSVKGYTGALFTGLTTPAIAAVVRRVIEDFPRLHGIYHLAADPIDKYSLLTLINDAYQADIPIQPDGRLQCDRRLDGSRFFRATGIRVPGWDEMIYDMRRQFGQRNRRDDARQWPSRRLPSGALST